MIFDEQRRSETLLPGDWMKWEKHRPWIWFEDSDGRKLCPTTQASSGTVELHAPFLKTAGDFWSLAEIVAQSCGLEYQTTATEIQGTLHGHLATVKFG